MRLVWHAPSREPALPGIEVWFLPRTRGGCASARAIALRELGPGLLPGTIARVARDGAGDAVHARREVEFYGGPDAFAIAARGLAALSAAALASARRSPVERAALLMAGALEGLGLSPAGRATALRATLEKLARKARIDLDRARPALEERARALRERLRALVEGPARRRGALARYGAAMGRVGRELGVAARAGRLVRPLDFFAFRFVHLAALHLEIGVEVEVALEYALAGVYDPT